MKVLIVDDHILFREALVHILRNQPDFEVVGEAGLVKDAIELALNTGPDVILMDFLLPDGNGLEAVKAILLHNPEINIVILTLYEADELLIEAIRCGAKGYLLKNAPVSHLLTSLRALGRGEFALTRVMTRRVLDQFAQMLSSNGTSRDELKSLTTREMEVLEQLGLGASNREIAERLFITENTVKNHVKKILNKLNLENRHQAARYARQVGLVWGGNKP